MTCIADFHTKKAFRHAVKDRPTTVKIQDPSIVAPYEGPLPKHHSLDREGGMITVTNHPKRSWFASVTVRNGRLEVD